VISILVVDDHELVRLGTSNILGSTPGLFVVGQAASGEEGVSLARKQQPNIVLMDIRMPPGIDGLEATKKILRLSPDSRVIMLTACDEDPYPARALQAGAVGYLTKHTPPSEMIDTIKRVSKGQRYVTPNIAKKLAFKQISASGRNPFDKLSERELQTMLLLANGSRVPVISTELGLSQKTVNTYRYRLFTKLGVRNDVELMHMALRYNLV